MTFRFSGFAEPSGHYLQSAKSAKVGQNSTGVDIRAQSIVFPA
jgi:hypothetical protein